MVERACGWAIALPTGLGARSLSAYRSRTALGPSASKSSSTRAAPTSAVLQRNENVPVPTLIDRGLDRVDQVQRRHGVLGFPHAVFKRYGEDNGSWLGALISYYGFFALFPMLVVFVTVATWALGSRPDLLHTVLQAIWSRVPFAGSALQQNVEQEVQKLEGNLWVAIASLLVILWGGLGVARVVQDGVNTVWGVARYRRPGFVPKIARSAAILGLLGLGLVASGVVAGLTVTVEFPVAGLVLAAIVTVGLTSAITVIEYHLTIAVPVSHAEVVPGAIMMGLGTYGLTLIASVYVQHVVLAPAASTARSPPRLGCSPM